MIRVIRYYIFLILVKILVLFNRRNCRIMALFEILCGVAAAVLVFYYYLTSNFDYWKSQGIRGPQPIPIFGNIKDVMLAKKFIGDYMMELYNNYKDESMIGIFTRGKPILVLKDLDFIKDVLIKNFSNFSERDFANIHEKVRLLQIIL